MKLKWVDGRYNGASTRVGPIYLDVNWLNSNSQYGFRCLGMTKVGFSNMDQAKEAAENELRRVLTEALEKLT